MGIRPDRRISRYGRDQRSSRSATGVPQCERPDRRFRAAEYRLAGDGRWAHNDRIW